MSVLRPYRYRSETGALPDRVTIRDFMRNDIACSRRPFSRYDALHDVLDDMPSPNIQMPSASVFIETGAFHRSSETELTVDTAVYWILSLDETIILHLSPFPGRIEYDGAWVVAEGFEYPGEGKIQPKRVEFTDKVSVFECRHHLPPKDLKSGTLIHFRLKNESHLILPGYPPVRLTTRQDGRLTSSLER